MSEFQIKICGLSDIASVDAALEAGADMVGFMFFPPSPRYVELPDAADLARRVRSKAKVVAVVVNPADELLEKIVTQLQPDIIQLHGAEPPARAKEIGDRFSLPVYKALGIRGIDYLSAAPDFVGSAEGLLFDAKPPEGADRPGGLGMTFDWRILHDYAAPLPTLLSGGLTPENVQQAVEATHLSGLDVSSGVEIAPGQKSPELIRLFIRRARAAIAAKSRKL